MNKIKILFTIVCIAISTNIVLSNNLHAYFSYASFYSPADGPYIETYLTIIGNTVNFTKNENGSFNASLNIEIQFKQNGDIVNTKKYNLLSPSVKDTTKAYPNFVDQQRIKLPEGSYTLSLNITDTNKESKPFVYNDSISISYSTDEIVFSDVQLLEDFKKAQ